MKRHLLEKLMDRFRPGWRERSAKKKSPWHLFKLVILITFIILFFNVLLRGYGFLLLNLFAVSNINGNAGLGVLPLIIPVFVLSVLITNIILHSIPAARKTFHQEAEGDPELMYEPFMSKFTKVSFKYILPLSFGASAGLMWFFNA